MESSDGFEKLDMKSSLNIEHLETLNSNVSSCFQLGILVFRRAIDESWVANREFQHADDVVSYGKAFHWKALIAPKLI